MGGKNVALELCYIQNTVQLFGSTASIKDSQIIYIYFLTFYPALQA